jgi:hypothetical protein
VAGSAGWVTPPRISVPLNAQGSAEQQFPLHFLLDATYCKARVNRRVVSQAVVIATGVRAADGAKSSASNTPST